MKKLPHLLLLYAATTITLLLVFHILSCSRTSAQGTTCCEKTTDGSPTRCYPC